MLLEGARKCLEDKGYARTTARDLVAASGTNLASIGYHFGSKDDLVSEAAIEGLDRWLEEIDARLAELPAQSPAARFRAAMAVVEETRRRHTGLARNYISAIAKAQHHPGLRRRLAEGFRDARPNVAAVLGLGEDQAGEDAGALVLSLFHGLLLQVLLDPDLAIDGDRMKRAQARLLRVLPGQTS
jgi:AcrR family transcriptional regulator